MTDTMQIDESPFPIHSLRVQAWSDPVVDSVGHDPRSAYVERFWLGVLGPSSTWLLRLLAERLERSPDGYALDMLDAAKSIGVGNRGGQHSPFMRSLARCCQFGLTRFFDQRTLLVRRSVPPLSARQVGRLPDDLQREHLSWVAPGSTELARLDHARRMALTLLEVGEAPGDAEAQLHRWRIHPAVAHEAVRWAQQQRSLAAGNVAPRTSLDHDAPADPARVPPQLRDLRRANALGGAPAAAGSHDAQCALEAATSSPQRATNASTRRPIPPPPPFIARPAG